jgi:hypothetical protein
MIDSLWEFLTHPWLVWAVAAGLFVAPLIWLVLRLRRVQAEAARRETPTKWPEWVAAMHDHIDQIEHLLRQFSQRMDKRLDEMQESVTELEGSVGSLEKPFHAVALRCSEVARDADVHRRRPK